MTCKPMQLRDKFVCCQCFVRWPCLNSQQQVGRRAQAMALLPAQATSPTPPGVARRIIHNGTVRPAA